MLCKTHSKQANWLHCGLCWAGIQSISRMSPSTHCMLRAHEVVLERGLKQSLKHSKELLHVGRQMWVLTSMQKAWKEAGFQRDEKHWKKRNALCQPQPAGQHESCGPCRDRQRSGFGPLFTAQRTQLLWAGRVRRPKHSFPSAVGLSQAGSSPGGAVEGSKTTKKPVNGRWRAQLWEDTSAIKREVNHQQTEPRLSQQQEGTHAGSGAAQALVEPYLRLLKRYEQNRGRMPSDITQPKDGLVSLHTFCKQSEKQPQTAEPRGPGAMNDHSHPSKPSHCSTQSSIPFSSQVHGHTLQSRCKVLSQQPPVPSSAPLHRALLIGIRPLM